MKIIHVFAGTAVAFLLVFCNKQVLTEKTHKINKRAWPPMKNFDIWEDKNESFDESQQKYQQNNHYQSQQRREQMEMVGNFMKPKNVTRHSKGELS